MATINTPAAGVSPYQAVAAAPTVLRAAADGTTVLATAAAATATVSELAATNANTLVVVTGQAALNSLITSGQPGVFDGANVTINLEEQNFTTTNQVTSTTNYPSGSTGEIQYNSGANSFASDAFFTYTSGNVVTPGIRTNGYFYGNGAPFTGGGNAAIGNFVFNGDTVTISDANQVLNITGNGTGNVNISANSKTWTFANNGTLTAPGNISSVGNVIVAGTNGLTVGNINNGNNWQILGDTIRAPGGARWQSTFGVVDTYLTSVANGFIDLQSVFADSNIASEVHLEHGLVQITAHSLGSNVDFIWSFDNSGNLTLPSNTSGINYANGSPYGSSSNYSNSNVSSFLAAFGSNTVLTTGNITAGNLDATNLVINSIRSDDSSFVTIEDGVNITTGLISAPESMLLTASANTWTFAADGRLTFPGTPRIDTGSNNFEVQAAENISLEANAVVNIYTDTSGNAYQWQFGDDGSLTAPGNISATGNIAGGNLSVTGNVTANYFIGNGAALTGITASVPSQTILPTIQSITAVARPAGLFSGGQGGANVTVANNIPVTEYGVIITAGTTSETYKTGALGSIPGTVSLTFSTGLNSTQYTLFAYVTSNAGTYYSDAVTGTSGICLLAGTQIALSDGTHKAIKDITYTDKLLSWDFDRGCYAETTAMWIKRSETGSQYNLLTFSDGTTLRTFDQHRIFNKQAGAFTYPMTDATPVGTVTVNEHGQEIILTSKQVIEDIIEYYNVITDYHMNLFSDSVLTSCRFNNIYPIVDMKFAKDSRTLRTRAEFENVPDRFFHGLRLAEQTADIETVEWYVNRLLRTEVSTHAELAV